MARNRVELDRADKEAEILAVAAELALTEGVDDLTASNVARRLGLARNAIAWYFPTRDDLLAATFRHLATAAVSDPPRGLRLNGQLQWATERLDGLRPLYLHLCARGRESAVADEAVRETQDWLYSLLAEALRGRVPSEDLPTVAKLLGVLVEGLLARPRTAGERAALLRLATQRLVPRDGSSRPGERARR